MKVIYFHTCYSRFSNYLKNLITKYCNENDIDLSIYNVDDDPDIMSDFNIYGQPPIFAVYKESGNRIAIHKGKFDENTLNKIFKKS